MPSLSLTRTVQFSARHRYGRADWTEAQNTAAFGDGALRALHEHRYTCEVTIAGTVDEATGMLVDLRALDSALDREVVRAFDGGTLNDAPEFASGLTMPTSENLAAAIARRLQRAMSESQPVVVVTRVSVAEDPSLRATWDVRGA